MANSFQYKDKSFAVGDTLSINYKLKEGDKERSQLFTGILIKIKGDSEANRMITVRKKSHSGIGIERIIPLSSPYIISIHATRKTNQKKAKIYYIRDLSEQELRKKLYATSLNK